MQQQLQEQFVPSPPIAVRAHTQEDIEREDDLVIEKRSRFLAFITDRLDEFEHRNRSTAGCLYAIFISFLLAFLSSIRTNSFAQIPVLELVFVSCLIMFITNFHLITDSNILPYIKDEVLNSLVKKTAVSALISVVLFVASLQDSNPSIGIFFYLSSWLISLLFETYINNQIFDNQEIFMALISWGGLAFALDVPILLLEHPISLLYNSQVLFAILGGLCLVYAGDSLRKLGQQNQFTITHVISLFVVIFLPLFFPVEGIKAPIFIDWILFFMVALVLLIFFPILIRCFYLEKQTLVIHYFSWVMPFYMALNFLFSGRLPSLFNLIGSGVIVGASLVLLSFQKVKIHSGSFYIEREKDDPNRPKNDVEMNLWTQKDIY